MSFLTNSCFLNCKSGGRGINKELGSGTYFLENHCLMHRPGLTCDAGVTNQSPGGVWQGLSQGTHPSAPSPAAAPRPRPLAAPANPARSGASAQKTSLALPGRYRHPPPSFTGSPAPAPRRLQRLPGPVAWQPRERRCLRASTSLHPQRWAGVLSSSACPGVMYPSFS